MPQDRYIKAFIDEEELDLHAADDLPIAISYKLEDREDFQQKKSSESFNVKVPASLQNDRIANTFHNPGIEDLTPNLSYRSARKAVIEAGGCELLVGKAFLQDASHDYRPLDYTYDFYGNNADWMIDLKEATLFDFLKHINFTFTKQAIIDSWAYDGMNEALPYVFAPVRYGSPMDTMTVLGKEVADFNMLPIYMKPSLSPYWLLYWGFKSVGYRIQSDFFNLPYFRRATMPWTWGNFMYSEGTRVDELKFFANSTETLNLLHVDYSDFADFQVKNDTQLPGVDPNDVYSYDEATREMRWSYKPPFNYGKLEANFHLALNLDLTVTTGSEIDVYADWLVKRSGSIIFSSTGRLLASVHAGTGIQNNRKDFNGVVDDWFAYEVEPNDMVICKIWVYMKDTTLGRATLRGNVDAFELEYFRSVMGSTIDFNNFTAFKKYKFLDFMRGIVDAFNLAVQTDPISKVVYIEPTHPYSLTNDLATTSGGYFNGNYIDWTDKQDLSKKSTLSNFNDSERELVFRFKDDSNDGILKVIQDRNVNKLGTGKYVFPDRFKAGKKEIENRFFSLVMHYAVDQWRYMTGTAPQMICLVPENISNTSRSESQNTFSPKLTWYKGLVNNVGWMFDGVQQTTYPYMFAVNYQAGGENDPIFSYSDERIGPFDSAVVGKGLLRRFFLQRMAIIRNGQYYQTYFRLNNMDVANFLHREHIICRGQKWELVEINNYRPLKEESTGAQLRKWVPVAKEDADNVYPINTTVLETSPITGAFDIKYATLKCLPSDIPTT